MIKVDFEFEFFSDTDRLSFTHNQGSRAQQQPQLQQQIPSAAAMAASTYLLELDQRRDRLLSDLVDHLGIPSGSAEHELALTFAARSLAHHDCLDAESKKVIYLSSTVVPYDMRLQICACSCADRRRCL